MWGDLRTLVRQHLWPTLTAVLGAVMTIGSIILHGIATIELGLPWWVYMAIGQFIFFAAVIVLVSRLVSVTSREGPAVARYDREAPEISVRALPVSTPASKPRVFVGPNVTLNYLSNLFAGRTSIEGNRLAQPYIGKWIRVSLNVSNISHHTNDILVLAEYEKFKLAAMTFAESWVDRLSILTRGDKINAIGMIAKVALSTVDLDDCELNDAS
jgi:hypothetical protein